MGACYICKTSPLATRLAVPLHILPATPSVYFTDYVYGKKVV